MLVSVIIPALNEAKYIRATLACARREYTPEQVEILVVDGGSVDGTPEVVPADVPLIHAPRGRAVQMNHGARASHGQLLVFCHADTRLPARWREAVIEALSQPGVSGGAFQLTYQPARGYLRLRNRLRLGSGWRTMMGDQCQFMSRTTFERIGGYPEIPLMEDVEMSRALHRAGRLVRVPLHVTTSSRRFLERGPLRQWLLSVTSTIRYLYLGARPEQIAATYRSSREELAERNGSETLDRPPQT